MPGRLPGPDHVALGRMSGVFGLRGELRVLLYNPDSDFLRAPREVVLASPGGQRRKARLRCRPGAGRRVLGRVDGVDDREAARSLIGWEILVPKAALPVLPEGEWYHHQLLGLEVVSVSGRSFGRLCEIHDAGEVDVWVSRDGEVEHAFPARRGVLVEVDLEAGRVVVADGAPAQPAGA